MAELNIKPGTKLQLAFDVPMGQKVDFNMMATYKGAVDEAYFLISVPMFEGKQLILDENQKFHLQYHVGENTFMLAAYPESVQTEGSAGSSNVATSASRFPCAWTTSATPRLSTRWKTP